MSDTGGSAPQPLHAEFPPLLALWDETRGPRPLPLWRDFRPERMAWEIFGRLFLVEVIAPAMTEAAPPAFRYGLIGEELVDTFGRRATGRMIGSDLFSDEGEAAIAFHAEIVRRRRPCLGRGYAAWAGGRLRYEDLYLPFARQEGGDVSVIVGAMRFFGRRPEGQSASVNEVSWQEVDWF
jgi:hypothetical protein